MSTMAPRRQPGASAMPTPEPSFPVYVLNRIVLVTDKLDLSGGWKEIPCASRRAYGCGDNIQEALEGLTLYLRLGDGKHLNSSLAVRMTEGARRRFESELDPDYYRRRDDALPSDMVARAHVEMAEEQGVTAIYLSFTRPATFYEQPHLVYYLVYDSIDTSLSMFQVLPEPCQGAYEGILTLRPIVPKRTDGSDYRLLLLSYDDQRDLLWVSTLSASEGTGVPFKWRCMDFPPDLPIDQPFNVDVAFSCQGKAFWGDLKQGLVYFDLRTGDFDFVKLPCQYEADVVRLEDGEEITSPVRNTRTLGCVGDSVRFVCIDMRPHYTKAVVRTWELVLPERQGKGTVKVMGEGVEWKEFGQEVPAKVLLELSGFKKAGLPVPSLEYPILAPNGAICFVLVDQSLFPQQYPMVDHFCIFDMDRKRLLWDGLVHNYTITDSLVTYPSSSFLQMKQAMTGTVREAVQLFEKMAVGST